jgi:hypothetical protein
MHYQYSLAPHGGCTKPGCHVPPYGCEVHHAVRDWKRGGQTNINELTWPANPTTSSWRTPGWTARVRKDGRTEWIPPPELDTGQTRVNDYHQPERMLIHDDDDEHDGE